jgi:hypothetical protein
LIILGIAVFVYSWDVCNIRLSELFNPGPNFGQVVKDFVSIDLTVFIVLEWFVFGLKMVLMNF